MNSKFSKNWTKKFAFFPTSIEGKMIWLKFYKERYVSIEDVDEVPDFGDDNLNVVGWWERVQLS